MTTTPNDIKKHLRRYLPTLTDLFTVTLSATADAAGNTVTVTAANHGLNVGDKVNLSAGSVSNLLASVVDNGDGTVRFTTTDEHDLTAPKASGDPKTLSLSGFGNDWDNNSCSKSSNF
jgi:hypothetical protein